MRVYNGLLAVMEDPFNPPGRRVRRYRGVEYPEALVASVADGWELIYRPRAILPPLAKCHRRDRFGSAFTELSLDQL